MTALHRNGALLRRRAAAAGALLTLAVGLAVTAPSGALAAPGPAPGATSGAAPGAGSARSRLPESAPTRSAKGYAAVPAPAKPLPVAPAPEPPAPPTGTGETGWKPATPPLTTPWTADVSPTNALPDYPRPQLARDRWQNLNGVWQFSAATAGQAPPVRQDLPERVLVPYPVESALSGIYRHEDRMWYRRMVQVPATWNTCSTKRHSRNCQRLVLQFGAVDYTTTVWVNGVRIGSHSGGYDSFSMDVTDALDPTGPQELVVGVEDPTDAGEQPLGKQRANPGGIFYTPTSGIWQTVWMEPVSTAHITRLDLTPDVPGSRVRVGAQLNAPAGRTVEVTAYDGTRRVGQVTGPAGSDLYVPVPRGKLWSPSSPFLYDLRVRVLERGRHEVDRVRSYVGMRSITLGTVNGVTRPLLNGKFVFQLGTLDQGYWPDGNLTAPTDAALRSDLEQQKALGFNTVRKHIKVEPARWYYWADKMGMMVWQDMPAMRTGSDPSPTARVVFENQLRAMVDQLRSAPSIVEWTPFNEGWGEYDPARIVKLVQDYDPSRLVDDNSGGNCCGYYGGVGDYISNHSYPDPSSPAWTPTRAAGLTEFGGLGLRVAGHEWSPGNGFAYEMEPDSATLTKRYVGLLQNVRTLCIRCGLSVAIYTQPYDVENEINGLFTYDRKVLKVDGAAVRAANLAVLAAADETMAPPTPKPGTPGLTGVGAWNFDEGSGTVAHDSSGQGHDGTLENDPTWVAGHTGSALQFDGDNDDVDTGASLLDTTSDYSVSAWVRLDSLGGFATAVSQDSTSHSEFFLQYSGADNRFAFSSVGNRALAPTAPQTGRWYHLVGVRDSVHNQLRLYVDGVLAGTTGYCPGEAAAGHTVIGRGQYNGGRVDFWRGALDEVHVYDRALSAAEVGQLAAA